MCCCELHFHVAVAAFSACDVIYEIEVTKPFQRSTQKLVLFNILNYVAKYIIAQINLIALVCGNTSYDVEFGRMFPCCILNHITSNVNMF